MRDVILENSRGMVMNSKESVRLDLVPIIRVEVAQGFDFLRSHSLQPIIPLSAVPFGVFPANVHRPNHD